MPPAVGGGLDECEEKTARRDVTKCLPAGVCLTDNVGRDNPAEGGVYTGTTGMPVGCSMRTLKTGKIISTRIFSLRDISAAALIFILALNGANFLARAIQDKAAFKIPAHWPISEYYSFSVTWEKLALVVAALGLFFLALKYLSAVGRKLGYIIGLGIILLVVTNFFQGAVLGFIRPITGIFSGAWQYYDEAVRISQPLYFFSHFENIQLNLYQHSVTHPPGATLIFYWLNKSFGSPEAIALAIAVFSAFFSGFFLYKILKGAMDKELSRYITFLFLLIPAIQIYYLACLEALVASLLLGALFFFLYPKPAAGIAGTVLFTFLASCLTFLFAFILPVLGGYELWRSKSLKKTGSVILGLALAHTALYFLFGYNYLNSFWIAATYENIGRATPLFHSLEYFLTRLEGILEIVLFFGPFLGILFFRGVRFKNAPLSSLMSLTGLGVFTLLAMFIAGFFRTGETARICLFIYPYLLFPVAEYFKEIHLSLKEKKQILALVFVQTVIMQLLGSYYW
jgi:hypothetical protein